METIEKRYIFLSSFGAFTVGIFIPIRYFAVINPHVVTSQMLRKHFVHRLTNKPAEVIFGGFLFRVNAKYGEKLFGSTNGAETIFFFFDVIPGFGFDLGRVRSNDSVQTGHAFCIGPGVLFRMIPEQGYLLTLGSIIAGGL